jgi:hypothetical protein
MEIRMGGLANIQYSQSTVCGPPTTARTMYNPKSKNKAAELNSVNIATNLTPRGLSFIFLPLLNQQWCTCTDNFSLWHSNANLYSTFCFDFSKERVRIKIKKRKERE